MRSSEDHLAALKALYPNGHMPWPVLCLLSDFASATGRIQGLEPGIEALLQEARWWREFALTTKARRKK